MGQIDEIIAKLQQMKVDEYADDSDAKFLIANMLRNVEEETGRYDREMAFRETRKQEAEREQQRKLKTEQEARKKQEIHDQKEQVVAKIKAKFPRYFDVTTDDYKILQPNGELFYLAKPSNGGFVAGYSEDAVLANRKAAARLLNLFRMPQYKQVAAKVQDLRDYGFNISSTILNTDGATFRTRFAVITNVVLDYKGPFLVANDVARRNGDIPFNVYNREIPGRASIEMYTMSKSRPRHEIKVENVSIGHIGEIIDTIDTVILCTSLPIPMYVDDIELMGKDVVQYIFSFYNRLYGGINVPNLRISSDTIDDYRELSKIIYKHYAEHAGFVKRKSEPEAAQTSDQANAEPVQEFIMKPGMWRYLMAESYEESVHPSIQSFWSGIRRGSGLLSKHPLMAMYGQEKAKKAWKKGVLALQRVFPQQLADLERNPRLWRRLPELSMRAFMKIMEIEKRVAGANRAPLIEIAIDVVSETYGIPKNLLKAKFTNRPGIDLGENEIGMEQRGGGEDDDAPERPDRPSQSSPQDLERLRDQINKRLTLNALSQGAAVKNMGSLHRMVEQRLNALSPELMRLYDQFSAGSHGTYWITDYSSIANLTDHAVGDVRIKRHLSEESEEQNQDLEQDGANQPQQRPQYEIEAVGMVFPVLLQELVKGTMELLSLHAFKDIPSKDMRIVLNTADKFELEPWMIQVGPELWDAFLKIIPRGSSIATVVSTLARKEPKFVHDLLSNTVEAVLAERDPAEQREILKDMLSEVTNAQDDIAYSDEDSDDESWRGEDYNSEDQFGSDDDYGGEGWDEDEEGGRYT